MTRKSAASAIDLIRAAAKSPIEFGNLVQPFSSLCSNFHNFSRKEKAFSPKLPRIDFRRIHELEEANLLFNEMVRMRPQPSVVDFTKLLNSVVKMKHYSAALYLFDEMRRMGAPVNDYTMNIAINCYCLLKLVDFGFSVMGIFLKSGYEPETTTFSTLIKGLILDDKVADATKLFKKIVDLRLCEPNDVMILTVIDGLCKAGQIIAAHDLLRRLERSKWKPMLGVKSYSALLDGLCKGGMVDDALQLLSRMIDKGISPNVVTYNSMIQGLCDVGRLKDVKDLISEMTNSNISLNGWKLFKDMEARQVRPDLRTYNILLNGLCRNGDTDEALSLLSVIEAKGVNPNVVTYGALINGLCKNGKHGIARDLFNQLPSRGVLPNVRTYTIIIGSLCQEASLEDVKCLLIEMENRGCAPDGVTYNVIVRSLLKKNELHRAIPFLEKMAKRGFSADSATFSMLINQVQGQTEDNFLLKLMKNVLPMDIVSNS